MKTKLLSLVMACAMALSLAIPAFATSNYNVWEGDASNEMSQKVDFEAKMYVPTVSLTLPTFTDDPLVLNPYKLKFSLDSDKLNGQTIGNGLDAVRQVISPVYGIENKTDVAMKFSVSATTTLGSSAKFTFDTKHVTLAEKSKKAYIALVVKKTETSQTAMGTQNATSALQELDPYDTANNETIVLGTGEKKSGNGIRKLAAAQRVSGELVPNYLCFQFTGSMSRTPDTGWTEDDTFSTQLVFTFTPESAQDYTAHAVIQTGSATQLLGADMTAKTYDITSVVANGTTAPTAGSEGMYNLKDGAGNATTSPYTTVGALAGSTPAWSLVSSGAYGATFANGVITYPATAGKTLKGVSGATNGTKNEDYLVIGFNDKNGVPRTLGLTVDIMHVVS